MARLTALLLPIACGLLTVTPANAQFEIQESGDGLSITIDGKLFSKYLVRSGAKPVLWPVVGPAGHEMTRGYPIRELGNDEKKDHIHHRSFWFTHGDVNGISFWDENGKNGTIEHREFLTVKAGKDAIVSSRNDWMSPDGKRICQDERTYQFGASDQKRWIDVTITVKATDGPVVFGDTKEGSFGVRVAGSMRTELGKGGRILNSEGNTDGDAWGKRAAWVDYSGPVNSEPVGVTIFNHPSSFRYPTYWHVRTYGLFAANPFGLHDFLRSNEVDGSHKMMRGESFQLKYRVLFYSGKLSAAELAAEFQRYAG